ncbi:hypothetical protein F7P73_14530 [Acinetobacter bohemicus]|uniref:Uncharacterized protein n=1 Tax=Acinetobacter bohemicus TaxID=1435036 RepID=A0A1I6VPJ1_9GAMM|nr:MULTISPECIES: hypothetical protein [Acinetobacter]KAB0651117.1 hypothetical protein F7P73_14530 [Acinetobacter bohemicus]SFT15660.1 hypothetical protein SAMN05444586_103014 [Acinetobacter bohemicus]
MSSTEANSKVKERVVSKAEIRFLEAFERLKSNNPEILPKGTPVTQNNVAKEAGVNPSALRSSRYPELAQQIQNWIEDNKENSVQKSSRQMMLAQRSKNRELREQITSLQEQRDKALSMLVETQREIVSLTLENERLKARLPAIDVSRIS